MAGQPDDCPPELLTAPVGDVYRERPPRKQCAWVDCPADPRPGRFCDLHRRWHAQRLLHQLEAIIEPEGKE